MKNRTTRTSLRLPTKLLERLRHDFSAPSAIINKCLLAFYYDIVFDHVSDSTRQLLTQPYGDRTDRTLFVIRIPSALVDYMRMNKYNLTTAVILALKDEGYETD